MKSKISLVVLLVAAMGTMLLSGCNKENSDSSGGNMAPSTNSMVPSTNAPAH